MNKIIKNNIRYELLNLVTLKYKCVFLDKKECLIYDHRPIQSRFFGLYPKEEYLKLRQDSKIQNARLAASYCINEKLHLPQEVLEYDIEQCSNNIDENGNPIVLYALERNRLYEQILRLQFDILSEESIPEEPLSRFSDFFMRLFYSEDELHSLRLKAIMEFMATGKSQTVEDAIKEIKYKPTTSS